MKELIEQLEQFEGFALEDERGRALLVKIKGVVEIKEGELQLAGVSTLTNPGVPHATWKLTLIKKL